MRQLLYLFSLSALSFLYFSMFSFGQNLVTNPGFELRNPITPGCMACLPPSGFSEVSSITQEPNYDAGFGNPSGSHVFQWWDGGGSADYYATDGTFGGLIPLGSGSGFFSDASSVQNAYAGNATGGFIAYQSSNPGYREYLVTRLSAPLVPGQQYGVEFYALLSSNSNFSTDDIGAYFSDVKIDFLSPPPAEQALQIYDPSVTFDFQAPAAVTDAGTWTKVCGVFTATTAAEFLYIGNVNSISNTTLTNVVPPGGNAWGGAYYYVDEVRVEAISGAPSLFCNTILPIELSSFSAEKGEDQKAHLEWVVASQLNNDYFSVERSYDLQSWTELERIDGVVTTTQSLTYQFIDPEPLKQIAYYRVKQTDLNGISTNTEIIALSCEDLMIENLFPSPTNGPAQLSIYSSGERPTNLEISDSYGRLVKREKLLMDQGINSFNLDFSQYATGHYFVRVLSEDGAQYDYRVISVN